MRIELNEEELRVERVALKLWEDATGYAAASKALDDPDVARMAEALRPLDGTVSSLRRRLDGITYVEDLLGFCGPGGCT